MKTPANSPNLPKGNADLSRENFHVQMEEP